MKSKLFIIIAVVIIFRLIFVFYRPVSGISVFNDDLSVHKIVGSVCAEPDVRRVNVRYVICVDGEFSGKVLFKMDLYPRFSYGDVLSVYGTLETPFEADDFSYKNYLAISGVYSTLHLRSPPRLISSDRSFLAYLYDFKGKITDFFESNLSEPTSALNLGLLLGLRKGFSDLQSENFQLTGLTHIVAVSGYNVSMVILLIDGVFIWVPRRIRFYVVGFMLFLFALITGLTASVVRAVVMGILNLLALHVGSSASFYRVLFLTALLIFIWNPVMVLYDVGFHLSFLSTIGVVVLSKKIKLNFIPDVFGIREGLILTLAAQIATLPIMIMNFHRVSLIAPIANILVGPMIPIIMLLGLLMLIFSFLAPVVALLSLINSTLVYFMFAIVNSLASLPFSSISF